MKIWFDTEFIDDGKTIDLISIGLVREDGHYYYALNSECNYERASPWVQKNVLPHLTTGPRNSRADLAADIVKFAGDQPEFWAYYADYDWVALCQLFGSMMQLPDGWPKFCMDVKQLCVMRGNPRLPMQKNGTEHHALEDARWTMTAWQFLQRLVPSETLPIPRLTALEQEMMLRAVGFAQAGEWPWEPFRKIEANALESGAKKIAEAK